MLQEIFKTTINFDELENWRDPERDDIPVTSFIGFYKAIGIFEKAQEYKKDHPDFEPIPIINIFCNTNTHKAITKFIERMWKIYSLKIDGDNHVVWDTRKWKKGEKHYAKALSKTVHRCLYGYRGDFSSYCPGIDGNIPDNEIVLGIILPDEEDTTVTPEA